MAAFQRLRITTECIRVVANTIAHRVIQPDRLLNRIATAAARLFSELHQRRVVTIDAAAGLQVFTHCWFSVIEHPVYRRRASACHDTPAKLGALAAIFVWMPTKLRGCENIERRSGRQG